MFHAFILQIRFIGVVCSNRSRRGTRTLAPQISDASASRFGSVVFFRRLFGDRFFCTEDSLEMIDGSSEIPQQHSYTPKYLLFQIDSTSSPENWNIEYEGNRELFPPSTDIFFDLKNN